MKIAIISDIHGNITGLNTVLADMGKVDMILCAGDLTGYYPFVNEVIEVVRKNKIITIKGNHDKYLIYGKALEDSNESVKKSVEFSRKIIKKENLEFLKNLPDYLDLKIENYRVLIYHASPWDKFEERIYPDFKNFEKFKEVNADVLILGHTHYPIIKKIGNLTLINPGSCGQPRDYNMLSYVMWDTTKGEFKNVRLKWDIEMFINKSKMSGINTMNFEVFKRKRIS